MSNGLCARDVDCRGTLRAVLDVKTDRISDLQVVKHDALEGLRVEESILCLSIDGNETESTISECLYFSLHVSRASNTETSTIRLLNLH